MKLAAFFLILSLFFSTNAFAYGLICQSSSAQVQSIELNRDGGEETVTVVHPHGEQRYLVLYHQTGNVVAIIDTDIEGGAPNRGIALVYNPSSGRGYLSMDGSITDIHCQNK
ncbi:hypothetical protein [Bdellovibrio bacteriovorus]|uniref:hypothetical protein n=1 Tax=Bdellovibrio bacteriovorus TaxID=959 RepID=UPI0035A71FA2